MPQWNYLMTCDFLYIIEYIESIILSSTERWRLATNRQIKGCTSSYDDFRRKQLPTVTDPKSSGIVLHLF